MATTFASRGIILERKCKMSYLERAVQLSINPENCEDDNWTDVINLCGEADSLVDELLKELEYIKKRFDLNHYVTNIASEVNADVTIRIEDLLAKARKEMNK
jgi:hypothetical protein